MECNRDKKMTLPNFNFLAQLKGEGRGIYEEQTQMMRGKNVLHGEGAVSLKNRDHQKDMQGKNSNSKKANFF